MFLFLVIHRRKVSVLQKRRILVIKRSQQRTFRIPDSCALQYVVFGTEHSSFWLKTHPLLCRQEAWVG